jgi:PKD repeat protein
LTWTLAAAAGHGVAAALGAGASPAVIYRPAAHYFGADSFAVRGADGRGATATIVVYVTIAPVNYPPTVTSTATTMVGAVPLSVTFAADGVDVNNDPLSYFWDFGDGQGSTARNPSHTYTAAGTYTATVTVTDPGGLTGSAPLTITAWAAALPTGVVYAWGGNSYGQLGNGTTTDSLMPVRASGLAGVVELGANFVATIARQPDGTVFAWGFNGGFLLGDGTTPNRLTPEQAPAFAGAVSVALAVAPSTRTDAVSVPFAAAVRSWFLRCFLPPRRRRFLRAAPPSPAGASTETAAGSSSASSSSPNAPTAW